MVEEECGLQWQKEKNVVCLDKLMQSHITFLPTYFHTGFEPVARTSYQDGTQHPEQSAGVPWAIIVPKMVKIAGDIGYALTQIGLEPNVSNFIGEQKNLS